MRVGACPEPHSFPTRRSSDLLRRVLGAPAQAVAGARLPAGRLVGRVADLVRVRHAHRRRPAGPEDRKSTRLNSSHLGISYAVFCLKKKKLAPLTSTSEPARSS